MGLVICTVAADNYLPKVAVMVEGLRRTNPQAKLIFCSLERRIRPLVGASRLFDEVVSGETLYQNFERFAFRHSVLECATAVKARLLSYALGRFGGADKAVFVDPDMAVYGELSELDAALDSAAILVTPFHLNQIAANQLLPLLKTGTYNLGHIAVRDCAEARAFLSWWDDKLSGFCYVDTGRGLFVDQKWIDIAASLFSLTVFRERGYNVAHWNIADRPVQHVGGVWFSGASALKTFHFSSLDLGRDLRAFRSVAPVGTEPIHVLRREYKEQLAAAATYWPAPNTWSFDYFDSGEQIAYETRAVCRMETSLLNLSSSPYAQSNEYFLSRSQF